MTQEKRNPYGDSELIDKLRDAGFKVDGCSTEHIDVKLASGHVETIDSSASAVNQFIARHAASN